MKRFNVNQLKIIEHQPVRLKDLPANKDEQFKGVLKRLKNVHIAVTGGTALGLYRDKKLIDSDTDIDFTAVYTQELEHKIRDALKDYQLMQEVFYKDALQQLVFLLDKMILDVHFLHQEGEGYSCYHLGGYQESYPRYFFDQVKMLDTPYGLVPFPANLEAFLFTKYGEDWIVPQYRKKGVVT
jgi:hypothetical protein